VIVWDDVRIENHRVFLLQSLLLPHFAHCCVVVTTVLPPTALLRQTNPNWKVFFLLAQVDRKFEGRVRNVLEQYGDLRVTLLNGYAPVCAIVCSLSPLHFYS
jgi:hypothetical protein